MKVQATESGHPARIAFAAFFAQSASIASKRAAASIGVSAESASSMPARMSASIGATCGSAAVSGSAAAFSTSETSPVSSSRAVRSASLSDGT